MNIDISIDNINEKDLTIYEIKTKSMKEIRVDIEKKELREKLSIIREDHQYIKSEYILEEDYLVTSLELMELDKEDYEIF